MRLLGQFKTSLFFLRKNFARTKTQIKLKPTNFLCLRSFYAQKIVAFIVFSSLNFISLVGFGLIWVFVSAKSFPKIQKKKLVWNCPNTLMYYTTDMYPYQLTYRGCVCTLLFLFVVICENLFFLWESFWILLICENLFLSMIVCKNLFFLSLSENKLVY